MLATRQKIRALNRAVQDLLTDGIYPTLSQILAKVDKLYHGTAWGVPQTKIRPAIEGQVIGGPDGKDIERTYSEMRDDLSTFYSELIDVADRTVSGYWMFQARKEIIKRKALHLIQAAESNITAFSTGGSAVFKDTFNSASYIDLSQTTAELNLEGGYATLPVSLNALSPISLIGAVVKDENYPTSKPHGSIMDALTDAANTGWYAFLDGGSYTCTILAPAATASTQANGLYVDPLAPMRLEISYSNDGHNFYTLVDESIRQERTWVFKDERIVALRIKVTGKDVGIRRLKLLRTYYDDQATFVSTPHVSKDLFGNVVPVDAVKVEVEDERPAHTSLKYYIQPLYADSPAGDWIPVGNSPISLSNNIKKTVTLVGSSGVNKLRPESGDDSVKRFYVASIQDNPIVESSRLSKGGSPYEEIADHNNRNCGQFTLDYYPYNWSDDLDSSHLPSQADWSAFGAYETGYIRPATHDISDPVSDVLQQKDHILIDKSTCFTEVAITQSETSSVKDWLVIGIIGTNSKMFLQPHGNYRFTTYVYMPQDTVVSNKPCLLYNPSSNSGAGNPVIAPFRVYLNDNLVTEAKQAWSGDILHADLSAYNATFDFKAGWNKLEVLVYYTGVTNENLDGVATSGVGIYIAANPYTLARSNPSVKVKAHSFDEKLVSEFTIRQLIRPGDNSCWAWTDTAPTRDILINYNPEPGPTLDTYIVTEPPVMNLHYSVPATDRPNGLRIRAELGREKEASSIPKLHGYRLIINPTGA